MKDYKKILLRVKQNLKGKRDFRIVSKARFIIRILEAKNISYGCDRAGIRRNTFYNWIKVLEANDYDLSSLLGKSRRPKTNPNKTSKEDETLILELRKKHNNGGRILSYFFEKETNCEISHSTVDKILKRNNISRRYRVKRKNPHKKRYSAEKSNDRVQFDTVSLGIENNNGNELYAVTAIDDHSRKAFAHLCEEKSAYEANEGLLEYINENGIPELIQTDNGGEFTCRYNSELNSKRKKEAKLALFEETLQTNNIEHHLIKPRTPQHNGKIERFHRTMKRELNLQSLHGASNQKILNKINNYINYYNSERPHSSIKNLTPLEVFNKSAFSDTG